MADRKWNNQGGSNRDGFNFKRQKPKDQINIPSFEDLKESQITSFRLFKPRRPKPNYGEFGDAIWVYDFYDDDLTIKEPEIDIPEIKEPSTDIRDTYISNYDPENASIDIFPYAIEDEYEIVVKYKIGTGTLKIYISSGQAFAARNDINDRIFDLSLVVESSQPISLDNRQPALINTITLLNSAQNPIYSLYEWLLGKLSIVTDYSAENPDPVISNLRLNGGFIRLPPTEFTFNSIVHNLFYGSGKEPEQICLFAINKVLKYDRSRDPEEGNWSVTYAANELPLCLDLNPDNPDLPIVLIQFTLGSLEEIESTKPNSVAEFATIRVVLLEPIATPLDVFVRISGTADPVFINIDEVDTGTVSGVNANTLRFVIPANTSFVEVEIRADIDPDQIGNKTVVTSLLPNPEYEIDINNDSITTTIKLPQPIVSIVFNAGSPTRLKAGNGAFFAYVSRDYVRNAVGLDVDLAFTGDALFDEYQVDNFAFSNQYQVTIPAGQSGVVVKIEPNTDRVYPIDRSIVAAVIPFQSDASKYAIDPANINITPVITPKSSTLIIKGIPNYSNPDKGKTLFSNRYKSERMFEGFSGYTLSVYASDIDRTMLNVDRIGELDSNASLYRLQPNSSTTYNGIAPDFFDYIHNPSRYQIAGLSYDGTYPGEENPRDSNESLISYSQIDLNDVPTILSEFSQSIAVPLRYLIFYISYETDSQDTLMNDSSYGTISASINDFIPNLDFNRFEKYIGDRDSVYSINPQSTKGFINWQWVEKYSRYEDSGVGFKRSIFYLMNFAIQIDSQDFNNIKFLDTNLLLPPDLLTVYFRLDAHRSPVVTP